MRRNALHLWGVTLLCVTGTLAEGSEIHSAIRKRDLAKVRAILEGNAEASNEPDSSGTLPLYRAMSQRETKMVELLLSFKADPTLKNRHGYSSIYYAVTHKAKRPYLEIFLKNGANVNDQDKDGRSLLYCAVSNGSPESVELLLGHKADVDLQDKAGDRPLHAACHFRDSTQMAKLLLAKAPKVNLPGRNGETPLHIACRLGRMDLAKMLLAHKADPDVGTATRFKESPIHYCGKYATDDASRITKMLVEAGGDPNRKDGSGRTPLYHTALHGNAAVAKELVAAGADLEAVDDRNGHTPLLVCASSTAYPNEEVGVFLITAGANIAAAGKSGWTPLLYAAARGKSLLVGALLKKGANANVVEQRRGWTPLHVAARGGREEVVKALLQAGGKATAKDTEGLTPAELALKAGKKDIGALLRSR